MEQTPSTTQPIDQQQQQQQSQLPATTVSSSLPPPISPKPSISAQSQTRAPFNTRPWHLSLPSPPPAPSPPRGIVVGIPAHPSPTQPPPASFSSLTNSSYGQTSQITQPMQGMGMPGSLGTTTALRPVGVPTPQLRPSQSSLKPQSTPSSQSPASQSFQGHGMLRGPTLGSPAGSAPPSSSQGPQGQTQPWLSSGGKPPLPAQSIRNPTGPQSFQQRSHISQQQHLNVPTPQQQVPVNSSQPLPQTSTSGQTPVHFGQPVPSSRIQQTTSSHQQQTTRGPGLGSQRPSLGPTLSSTVLPGAANKTATSEIEEDSDRIVSKRSIQDLVNQIDPSEKLDPDVEDILADIAEDFVDSITTFGCSLAKHRKSTTLEAKDILLHLERNWNMTLPGFGGDEIKTYKKPFVSDIHRERLAAIKMSVVATDTTTKNLAGPSSGNAKGHLAKGPSSLIGSPPNPKLREAPIGNFWRAIDAHSVYLSVPKFWSGFEQLHENEKYRTKKAKISVAFKN